MTRQPTGRRRMREHGSRKPQTCATIACMSTLAYALAVIAVAGVVFVFVATRREWKWTGFAGKTAWDWLGVLVIPVFLLLATVVLNAFQADREHAREDRDAARARALALDAQRDETLRGYVREMSALVLDRKLGPGLDTTDPEIGGSAADARVLSTARTLTLNALRRLDGERKGIVLRFLSESKLISTFSLEGDVTDPVVSLAGADLRGVYLKGAVLLRGPGFMTADLRGADFRGAFMEQPLFDFADHRGADFSDAVILDGYVSGCISGARFRRADLDGTQFSYVSGSLVDFSGARLDGVDFREARLAAVKGLSRGGTRVSPAAVDADCAHRLRQANFPGKGG